MRIKGDEECETSEPQHGAPTAATAATAPRASTSSTVSKRRWPGVFIDAPSDVIGLATLSAPAGLCRWNRSCGVRAASAARRASSARAASAASATGSRIAFAISHGFEPASAPASYRAGSTVSRT